MSQTHRSWTDLLTLLADNSSGDISPQDLRDAIYSFSQIRGGMTVTGGATTTALSGTFGQVDLADFTNYANSVGVVPDKANDKIILPSVVGEYWVHVNLAFQLSAISTQAGFKWQLDGVDIAESLLAGRIRPAAANVGAMYSALFPVTYASGNGELTLLADVNSGTPNLKITDGSIWVFRQA